MSRPIKFRAWDNQSKKFIKSDYFAVGLDGTLIQHNICYSNDPDDTWDDSWNEELDDEKYVVQQFTGLLDKNGKEIFEGDVLKYNSGNPNFAKVIVRWTLEDEDNCPHFITHDSYCQYGKPEIIGNICENPELLT